MKFQIIIRDFMPSDWKEYQSVSDMFYSSNSIDYIIPEQNLKKNFNMCINKNPYVRGLIIETAEEIVGFALLNFSYSNEMGGLILYIDEIFILPQFQGCGIFRKLFSFIELEYNNVAGYFLEVVQSNTHAIDIYKHFGFELVENLAMMKVLN